MDSKIAPKNTLKAANIRAAEDLLYMRNVLSKSAAEMESRLKFLANCLRSWRNNLTTDR